MADPSFREGDWNCERCGDHQFERNIMCRKCGAPKPAVSSNNQTAKAGDWICPNAACGDVQFERNMLCRKCGTPRPAQTLTAKSGSGLNEASAGNGVRTIFAPADWICASCGDHQFAKNAACRKCGAAKPAPRSTGRVGDWICPNPRCMDLQFERNAACRRCGTPKPPVGVPVQTFVNPAAVGGATPLKPVGPQGVAAQPFGAQALGQPALGVQACGAQMQQFGMQAFAAPQMQPGTLGGVVPGPTVGTMSNVAPDDWMCTSCGDHQFAKNIQCRKCGAPKPVTSTNNQIAKLGDWICPNPACKDVQFEKNQVCRRCGTIRPGGVVGRQGAYRPPASGTLVMAGAGQRRPMRPGDWACPNPACGDIQFEKNEKCRMCGTEKPPVSSNKIVFKAGDWICPNPACGDVQFERNTVCRQCGTPKPGAEATDRTRSRSPPPTGGILGA